VAWAQPLNEFRALGEPAHDDPLYAAQPALAGAVAADGGRPADDVFAALPNANWKEITGEFFLTA